MVIGPRFARLLGPLILGLGALWLVGRLWPLLWAVLWPFGLGGLLATAMEPLVRWLEARGLRRKPAALVSLAALVVAAGGLGAWAFANTWAELMRLARRLPAMDALVAQLSAALSGERGALGWLPVPLRALLRTELARAAQGAGPLVDHGLALVRHVAAATPDALFGGFVALGTAYALGCERPRLRAWLTQTEPGGASRAAASGLRVLRDSVWGLVRAQLLLALVTFVISLLGLALIGAPYVFLASLAAALFDLLPVVGPGLVYAPWGVGMLLAHRPSAALALGMVLVAIGLARWLLTPHLLGRGVGVHPFAALAAMYVGARVAGVPGLFLGPVAAALLRAAWGTDRRDGRTEW